MQDSKLAVDELVLVVHGVGDPEPGETLSLFARSIADQAQPLTENQEVLWLEEEGTDDRMVNTFSSHVRHLSFRNGADESGSVSLVEVFWGDLSRVKKGTIGAIVGLIQIVFGLRYLAYVAADQNSAPARMLQWLGMLVSRVIHGPLLAINAVLLLLASTAGITEMLWSESSAIAGWSDKLVAGCVGVCLLGALAGTYVSKNKVIQRFLFWIGVSSCFLAMMILMRVTGVIDPSILKESNHGIVWYCHSFVLLLGLQWFSLVMILIGMFLCWIVALFDHRVYRPAVHAALLLPAISVGAWGLFLPFIWTALSQLIDKVIHVKEFDLIFKEAIPLMGVQIMMAITVGIVMAFVLGKYTWWRDGNSVEDYENGKRAPRLIVNGWVQVVATLAVLIGMTLVIRMATFEFQLKSYDDHTLGKFLANANKYAFAPLVPLSMILLISFQHLRPALDIIGDIVTHFHFRRTLNHDVDEDNSFDIHEVSFREGTLYFSKRDAIQRRMKTILNHFRQTAVGNPKLTIVSHSQGTMIAIEVLNDGELDWINEKFCEVNLVTMGSPFSHVYQHYFAHFYPALNELFWSNLRNRLNNWVNIFRIDDFVGTEIRYDSFAEEGLSFSNHPVPSRGHNYYWCDKRVLEIIRNYNICQALHPHCDHDEFEQRKCA